jgi:hypothetical protein
MRSTAAAILVGLLFLTCSVHSQGAAANGSLSGTLRDPSGGLVSIEEAVLGLAHPLSLTVA